MGAIQKCVCRTVRVVVLCYFYSYSSHFWFSPCVLSDGSRKASSPPLPQAFWRRIRSGNHSPHEVNQAWQWVKSVHLTGSVIVPLLGVFVSPLAETSLCLSLSVGSSLQNSEAWLVSSGWRSLCRQSSSSPGLPVPRTQVLPTIVNASSGESSRKGWFSWPGNPAPPTLAMGFQGHLKRL